MQVHERAPTHGGKLGYYRRDGFTFDTGPSLLTLPQVFTDLFAATGGPADLSSSPSTRSAATPSPTAPASTCRTTRPRCPPPSMPRSVPAPARPGRRCTTARPGCGTSSASPVLHRPLRARDLARFGTRLRDLRLVAPWRTLRGLGEAMLPDPRLRMWLDRYATYSGSDPRRTPSVLSVTPYVEQRFGAWWVRGGLRRLADALLDRCRRLGVAVHLGSEVAAVTTDGRGVTGVRLAGGRAVPADVVVSRRRRERPLRAAPAAVGVVPRLGAPRPGRRCGGRRRRCRGSSCCSPSRARTRGPAHRVFFPPDYDAEFDALFRSPAPVADPTVYVHAPGDPGSAPRRLRGRGSCWSTRRRTIRSHGVDWDAPGLRERYADRVLEVLARRGVDVRDRIRWREVRTPADLERATGVARRRDLRHGVARCRGPRCCARRTAPRCGGCTWSAGPPTRVAGCPSWRCRRRSSPTWWGRRDGEA